MENQQPIKQCDKKRFTKKQAQTVLNALINNGLWNKKEGRGRYYFCPPCGCWHITSRMDHSTKAPEKSDVVLTQKDKWQELLKYNKPE